MFFDEIFKFGIFGCEGFFILELLGEFPDLNFVGVAIELSSFDLLVPELKRISPIFIIFKELAQPLDFSGLEQTNHLQV